MFIWRHRTAVRNQALLFAILLLCAVSLGLAGCSGLVSSSPNNTSVVPPLITTQPASTTVTAGQTATFAVAATGTAPLSYQWKKSGTAISGATSSSYTTPATTSSDNGAQFTVVVSNTAGTMTSSPATLTVNSGTVPPSVPTGLTAGAASSSEIDLSWNASTGSVAGYKIFRGGNQIGTSTTTSFADTGLTASTTYSYTVSAFDASGNASAQSAGASATTLASSGGGGIPNTLGWFQIPNTAFVSVQQTVWPAAGDPAMVMAAWGGGAYDSKRNRLMIWGGGHGDYKGNEVYVLDLSANPIAPRRLNNPDQYSPDGTCHSPFQPGSSNPSSRHTYGALAYLPTQDKMVNFGGSEVDSGCFGMDVWAFDEASLAWTLKISNGGTGGGHCDYDRNKDNVHCHDDGLGSLFDYNPVANTMTEQSPETGGAPTLDLTAATEYDGKRFYVVGGGYMGYYDISGNAPYPTRVNMTVPGSCTAFASGHYPGLQYDPVQKVLVEWHGGNTVNTYNPATNSCGSQTYSGGPGSQLANGTNGRFRYVPSMGVFILCNTWAQNCYSLRMTPGGTGGPSGPTISAVGVSSITTSGATVGWTTDVGATSQVEYGTTTAYGSLTTLNSSMVTSHSVQLSSLSISTLYHYRVHSKNSGGTESITGDFAFATNNTTDTTPPTVSITSPTGGATVSAIVTVAANATDNVGVTAVQFLLDGANLGAALTTPPYTFAWDTTTAANGSHTLLAKASDAAGNVGTSIGVSVTVSNSTSSADQNFQMRCASPGVLNCQGFDSAATFTSLVSEGARTDGFGISSHPNITRDTSVFISGGSSANFLIPAGAGENDTGNWWQFFGQGANNQFFGQNSTFYVQYGFRADATWTSTDWTQFGPAGSNTSPKLSIFHNVHAGSCAAEEVTTHNHDGRNLPAIYTDCGSPSATTGADGHTYDGSDSIWQQGWNVAAPFTGYECDYGTGSFTGPNCFHFVPNQWYTIYFKVHVGTWGAPNSSIEAWIAPYGQQLKKFINVLNNFPLYVDTTCDGSATDTGAGSQPCHGFDVLQLTQFMTGKIPGTGPAAHVWYDEVIISSQPIPAPAGQTP
jgi:Bacterial Ig domain/Immunoglobulin domain